MTQNSNKLAKVFEVASMNGPEEATSSLGLSLFDRIGNTPLLRLDAVAQDLPGVALLGKA